MELGTILGFVLGFAFTIASMILAANGNVSMLMSFIDASSFMIVVGGAIASSLVGNPISDFLSSVKAAGIIFKNPDNNPAKAVTQIIELANLARKEGLLALEELASNMEDPFLKKGVMLIVDGTDPELVRSILETEMAYIDSRHRQTMSVWEVISTATPAWGMMGTVISLIIMLSDLSDPNIIGPSMSLALITTLYGSFAANLIAIPIASKLKLFSDGEMLIKEVLTEGMLSIQAGENPRIIEEKLKAFLPPKVRLAMGKDNGGSDGDDK